MKQQILTNTGELVHLLSGRKVFLVCGGSFDRLPIAEKIKGLPHVRFSDFAPNPLYEDVCKAVALFLEQGCDAILAVGGGSAMDVAKCVKLFCKMDPRQNYLHQEYTDTGVLLAAVPTTAGTGSESTRHAVIYYRGEKQSISHPSIVPNAACLIPQVLENLPLYQKKCTMLDALCQAIESWWSVSSTPESVQYSRSAIELIRDNWERYLAGDEESAAKILLAANASGRAINITATTAAHAMSYKLTSLYRLPHGHAVGLCMAEVWCNLLEPGTICSDPRGAGHLKNVLQDLPVDLHWYRDLLSKLEMESPVSANREEELQILASSVNPVRLKNHPAVLDAHTLKAMYERIVP